MSGIVGHTTYAMLGEKAAAQKKLPIVSLIRRHYSSYLCGSYLGCDVQTAPSATCVDTGQSVGYGSGSVERSPITGGAVKPWTLTHQGRSHTPKDIHRLFYGRAHIVFGWSPAEREHTVPWEQLPDYAATVIQDAIHLFGPGERKLAYLLGWLAHIVGDSLIKSVQPGITLDLLDGKYTPANRPIQDLVAFHEIGRKEFRIHWPHLLADLVDTPVEPVQLHYMRIGRPRGMLAAHFPNAWAPQYEKLLPLVLAENRRYQRVRNPRIIKELALTKTMQGWKCDEGLSRKTGGLSYPQMIELAEKANFRHALWQMGEAVATLFEQVVERVPALQDLPEMSTPTWGEISARWKKK